MNITTRRTAACAAIAGIQMPPLAIDLFCGLGGWTEGLLAEGYRVVGFDVERHVYGSSQYPAQLVLQDVLTMHGRQFASADLIVASPPCQAYSYRAMPWKKAKALPPPDNALFEACFRIQAEASEAAGRYIPLVVENVRGAQKWVGRARWHFGSFYLWGDVPALMPMTKRRTNGPKKGTGNQLCAVRLDQIQDDESVKCAGMSWSGSDRPRYKAQAFNTTAEQRMRDGLKVPSDTGRRTDTGNGARFTSRECGVEGVKQHGSGPIWFDNGIAKHGSKISARKAASAHIAKIPLILARHVARAWHPDQC